MPSDTDLFIRVLVGFALAFLFGFEREVRGSPAGDRTFALVGAAAAMVTAVVSRTSPQAVAGVVTGIGFIGGGVVFHAESGGVRGLTTAATIFAAAALGVVVGYGHLLVATLITGLLLVTLELQHLPLLRRFDAQNFRNRFQNDEEWRQNRDEPPTGRRL